MTYFAISGILGFLVGITCSVFVFFNKPRTPLKILWSCYGMGIALWGFGAFSLFSSTKYQTALFWGRVMNLDAIFVPAIFFHLVILLTNTYEQYKKSVIIYYCIFILYELAIILLPQYYIPSVSAKQGFMFYPDAGPLYYLFPFFLFGTMTHGCVILHKSYQKASAIKRNQYKYFLWITAICLGGASTALFPVFNIPIYPFGVWLTPFHDVGIAYIIIKYHLLDIRIIIRKGLIYTILASFITLFYLVAVYSLEKLFHSVIGYHSIMGSICAMVFIAFLFIPLKDYIQSFVDKYFFKASYAQMIEQNDLLRQQSVRAQRYQMLSELSQKLITELRSPLTVLVGYEHFLPKRINDHEFLNKFVDVYHKELQRLQALVKQLSDFSESKPLNLHNINVIELMDELVAHLSENLQRNDVKLFKYYNEQADLMINADREQLKRALYVFLTYSIKSTPAKGQIWVGMEESMEGLEISIKDTGNGLSPEELSRIFDPLFSVSKGEDDTNVPLAQAQNIITHHSGKVMVESQVNVGTEWIIQLPILRDL